jgi:hypothetical protein
MGNRLIALESYCSLAAQHNLYQKKATESFVLAFGGFIVVYKPERF